MIFYQWQITLWLLLETSIYLISIRMYLLVWVLPSRNSFLNCVTQNGLTQIVTQPTHGSNSINLVLVSSLELIWDISIVEPFSSSCDHAAINFSVYCPNMIIDGQNRCFLDLYNADYCSMISIIKDIDWSLLCSNILSVEMFWWIISNVLHSCIAQFVARHYQSYKPFSYPKHIRHLLAMKKVWYSKDRVHYKHFARLYDELLEISSCPRNWMFLKENAYHPSIPMWIQNLLPHRVFPL